MRLRPANPTFEPCLECNGDGYQTDYNGPGRYDDYQECWYPSEELYPCDACQGTGHAPPPYEPYEEDHGIPWQPSIAPDAHLEQQHEGFYEPDLPF